MGFMKNPNVQLSLSCRLLRADPIYEEEDEEKRFLKAWLH
jgi:hypothetical protein